eukprot:1249879-Rhodomonas_salina.1
MHTNSSVLTLASSFLPSTSTRLRDLLQARSFCFPTATIVSRNHGGSWSTKCALCRAAVDTYGHRFMSCPELHGAQQTMHDSIALALIDFTAETLQNQGQLPPQLVKHVAERVDVLWPDCPEDLRDFVPDGIIITYASPGSKHPSRVVIIEFAQSYTIESDDMETAAAAKRNQYHCLQLFLENRYPEHQVSNLSYIMSVQRLGLYCQGKWVEH